MRKAILSLFITFVTPYLSLQPCGSSEDLQPAIVSYETALFKPDIFITTQLPQDQELLEKIRPLFFETDKSANPKKDVYIKSIREHGGQEIILLTDDNMRISALYFKRPNAKVNLIYVPGYFFNLTPTKEWGAPFSLLFPEFNVLVIDWRGFGESDGVSSFLSKNSFGKNAYPDIQAALDFMAKENKSPNILIGFCFGAAMIMHATIEAQQVGRKIADALVLNCIFTKFENQFNRAVKAEDRCLYRIAMNLGISRWFIEHQTDGSLFSVNPIDLIKEIKIPCYFEHYSFDPFAILEEGIEVYNACTSPKMFMQSDIGKHVRIHTKIPYQYREAFLTFLKTFGLYDDCKKSFQDQLVLPSNISAT